ncbi:MAG: hypothetical protein JO122_19275 [Acetobacteraceae bacterium]|nr:hypothetical protein [Acetobacteraceae bacterium]
MSVEGPRIIGSSVRIMTSPKRRSRGFGLLFGPPERETDLTALAQVYHKVSGVSRLISMGGSKLLHLLHAFKASPNQTYCLEWQRT